MILTSKQQQTMIDIIKDILKEKRNIDIDDELSLMFRQQLTCAIYNTKS